MFCFLFNIIIVRKKKKYDNNNILATSKSLRFQLIHSWKNPPLPPYLRMAAAQIIRYIRPEKKGSTPDRVRQWEKRKKEWDNEK